MTTTKIIDGKSFSEALVDRVAVEAQKITAATGAPPGLAVVLVGHDPASTVYVRNKIARTTAAGMRSIEHRLDANASQNDLMVLIDKIGRAHV